MMLRLLLALTLLVACTHSAKAPVPFCNSKPIFKQGPLSYKEKVQHDFATSFSGYNLNIQLASNNSFAKINSKFYEMDKMVTHFPGLITHHIEQDGNNWGKQSFLLYQDPSSNTHFVYGLLQDSMHVPQFDFTLTVTKTKTERCFGAALFLDYGLAVVDCMNVTGTGEDQVLQNFFVYIDLPNHEILKTVNNPMFVKFTEITQRRTMKFKDPQTGYTYLLRAYEAEAVDKQHRMNTYMEIFSARDPTELQLFKVIDRTFMHVSTLSITDAKVYLGDIFFLDYLNGLYRLDIMPNQDVLITGRYDKEGFMKFGIYSDDLEDELIIAVANAHAVYEIEWANRMQPVTLNKYSLIEHSHVRAVTLNDRYLVVQSAANVTSNYEQNEDTELDYTWIFTKSSRTYMNAYHIIDHNSSKVEVAFNREKSAILIADGDGLALFQLDEARLTLQLTEESKVGQQEDVVIIATSSDPHSKDVFKCQQKFTVHLVKPDDLTIYETGMDTTSKYSSNYPGQLMIPLRNYMVGPNVTYTLTNTSAKYQIPSYWIDKVNETTVHADFELNGIIFFHTQVIPRLGNEKILYFIQDSEYRTHVVTCSHVWESIEAFCTQAATYNHTSQIAAFTTAFFEDEEGFNYFYIFLFQLDLKTIHVIDYGEHKPLLNITYHGHQQAEITDIASSNGYLYVLRGAVKTIDVYKLSKCQEEEECKPDFYIDAQTLKPLHVEYFAPTKLVTDITHPQVLFIRCLGSVLILDIDNKQRITVLDEIISPATTNQFYRIAVNLRTLVIVSDPDIIDVYSLDHVYTKNQVRYMRRLPIYSYQIQPISDIQFSDVEDLIYINAVDPAANKSVVLVYRPMAPAPMSLFNTFTLDRLYSRPSLEIEVSGFFVDFLNIKTDNFFRLYRVFENPRVSIKDTFLDFKFQIQYENSQKKHTTQSLEIQTVNYPSGFQPTKQLNKTLKGLQLSNKGFYTWNDQSWFTGHILSYNYSCEQCHGADPQVKVREHVDLMKIQHITSYDYAETMTGGMAVYQDLVKFHLNGSVHEVVLLPDQKYLQRCQKLATAFHSVFTVTACQQLGRGINLYVTSGATFKSWTWGPYRATAYNARNLQIAGELLMLTDTSQYPEYKFEKGQVFLYALAFDKYSGEELEELEVIDENDFMGAHGYDKDEAYIGNSHLAFDPTNDVYRLYLTEVDSGLFVVDFTYKVGRRQINIVRTSFIDMKALLEKNNMHMPSDGSFQAVTLSSYKYSPHFDVEAVIVTTKGYHNFEVLLAYDDDGNVQSSVLHRVYYRYAYYNTFNDVRVSQGYVAIPYVIPPIYEYMTNYTRQIVAVYDTSDYTSDPMPAAGNISARYMLGAFRSNKTTPLVFAFNTTYDFHSNGTRHGLIVTSPFDAPRENMYELSLAKNLTAELKGDFDDQTLTFIPYNDFDRKTFEMVLHRGGAIDDEGILALIIIVLAVLITIGFAVYICLLIKNKKKIQKNQRDRRSLLTENSLRETLDPQDSTHVGSYQPPPKKVTEEQRSGSEGDEQDNSIDEEPVHETRELVREPSGSDEEQQPEQDQAQPVKQEIQSAVDKVAEEAAQEGEKEQEKKEEQSEVVKQIPKGELADSQS